jgi:cytoskeletal protein CcmA (bactofilin family)
MSKSSISILDKNSFFTGSFFSLGNIDFLSKSRGIIIAKNVFFKDSSSFSGTVCCLESLTVEDGNVTGDVYVKYLKLGKNSIINGNIFYEKIAIEDGAVLNAVVSKVSFDVIEKKALENKDYCDFINNGEAFLINGAK